MLHRRFGWFGASYFCVLTYIWKPFQGSASIEAKKTHVHRGTPSEHIVYNKKFKTLFFDLALRAGSFT